MNSSTTLLNAISDIKEVSEAILSYPDSAFSLTPFDLKRLRKVAKALTDPNNTKLLTYGLVQLQLLTQFKKDLPEDLVRFAEHKALRFKQMRQDEGRHIQ